MIERPTTPGDWIQWDGPDGKWENYMGMIGEDSNRIPSINPPFENEGQEMGAYIHHHMACRLLGKDHSLPSMNDLVASSKYVDHLMMEFVDKNVEKILAVEATIPHPDDDDRKVRLDLIAYCKDHSGECTIIDWKFVKNKFYFNNYYEQMELYKKAYNEAQCGSFGPLLSDVLVVAINTDCDVAVESYGCMERRQYG